MAFDLVQIRQLARRKEDENLGFRQFLKTRCDLEPSEIDRQVFEITRRVWANIDCTTCAACCREVTPTFSKKEVDRVAHRLGMERQELIDTYFERSDADSENPWQTHAAPCPFLKDTAAAFTKTAPTIATGIPSRPRLSPDGGTETTTQDPGRRTAGISFSVHHPVHYMDPLECPFLPSEKKEDGSTGVPRNLSR